VKPFPKYGLIAFLISGMGMSVAEPAEKSTEPARPFPLRDVRLLDGPFKQIQELHRTGMVGQLEPDRLLFQFRKNAGLPQPPGVTKGYGGWDDGFLAGHYAGHYLTAAARMYAATGDISFRDKATYMVKVLGECQDKLRGGYLSAFPAARLDRLEANPRQGLVEYYTLHKILAGLVDVARQCDNRQALEIAAKLSDYVAARLAKLSPAQVEALFRTDYTGNPVNEFGGMAEALADLYAVARQQGAPDPQRHLRLALLFNRDWFVEPLLKGEDKLNGIHSNTHAAQVTGIAGCALASGVPRLGTAAEAFWKLVVQKHSFVNGGNGFDEKLRAAGTEVAGTGEAALRPMTAEYCGTYNMLKIASYLFQRAPAVAYGDYYETALFNHILAGIAPDHGKVMYHMSMRPGDYRVHIDEPYCCQGTGIENAARFGEAIYFHRGNELWVNLYIASTLDWHEKGLKLRLDTRYPQDGVVRLTVAADAPVEATVNFRIPSWLQEQPKARVNGRELANKALPGTFLAVARTWKDGDIVELRFPLGLRVRPSMDDPAMVSFFYGPVLLAGKLGRVGMPASDIGGVQQNFPPIPVPVLVTSSTVAPAALLKPVSGKPTTYVASMVRVADRSPVEVELAPFYQVHHQRYAVYWKVLKPEELDAYAQRQAKLLPKAASFIGDAEAEKSRNLQGERTSSGSFSGRMWRAAEDGGWFSYRLQVVAGEEQELVCTYWGSETGNRVFDILIEGTKVATQTLRQNKPNEFFDVVYRIPAVLVHGKQFVTVRFQAHPGAIAGGIFHCAIVKSATQSLAVENRPAGRWPAENAWVWYKKQPWIVGFNFVPSTACNTTQWWQEETFDRATIDRELSWASGLGFNSTRVFIQYIVWKDDPAGFKKRFERFLALAAKHGITVMPVLFDDCGLTDPVLGKQREPTPGMILPSWTQSPGRVLGNNPAERPMLKRYVQDMLTTFGKDSRIVVWDLFNEPMNNFGHVGQPAFLEELFAWAHEVRPEQPLTICVWHDPYPATRVALAQSDVVSFHLYSNFEGMQRRIADLKKTHKRPILCTEWMARPLGSKWATDLSLFKEQGVGCYNWGLVNGRTQCQFSWFDKRGTPEPKVWFHDLFHKDGTPYDPAEHEVIRKTTADKTIDWSKYDYTKLVLPAFTDGAYRFSEGWIRWTGVGPNRKRLFYANEAGKTVTATVTGRSVVLIHKAGPDCGIAAVTIDGKPAGEFDTYSAEVDWNRRTTVTEGLSDGTHEVVIMSTGKKSPQSQNAWVQVVDIETTSPAISESQYRGWKRQKLGNEWVELQILPEIGSRVPQCRPPAG
jgi:uncharacterized protein